MKQIHLTWLSKDFLPYCVKSSSFAVPRGGMIFPKFSQLKMKKFDEFFFFLGKVSPILGCKCGKISGEHCHYCKFLYHLLKK
jgi:hypothetical protein